MKSRKQNAFLATCYLLLSGCGTTSYVESLGDSYVEVRKVQYSISEPGGAQTILEYRPQHGPRIVIWPSLREGPYVRDGKAVFLADYASSKRQPGERWPMVPRFFCVSAPDLPLDITDLVFRLGSKQSGQDLRELLRKGDASYIKETNNLIAFHFSVWRPPDWPPMITVQTTWDQISDMMREVKAKGVIRKDLRYGTRYIQIPQEDVAQPPL